MKGKRYFNTSGPNIPEDHYTLDRFDLIAKGKDLVYKSRYFTIWAPRQTGKSTYFRFLARELEKEGYKVAHINFENYRNAELNSFLNKFIGEINRFWETHFEKIDISDIFYQLEKIKEKRFVLIIDEVEGINVDYLNDFLHAIRSVYHSRENHCLKSVILVGVSNITGIIQDNASPFNIADELDVPYFTNEETKELLEQHEVETGQLFDEKVKEKISEITANQPGLVNGFARRLVETNPNKDRIDYEDYLVVEEWYLNKKIDKNVSNIIKIAKRHRKFVERLLFLEEEIDFDIDHPAIQELHINGLLTFDKRNKIEFWVPLYKKRLYKSLYPYTNGEGVRIAKNMLSESYLTEAGKINFDKLIGSYKSHIQLRGFRPYRQKDKKGRFKSIPEAAMIYSFETFISIFLQEIEGKSYREAYVSLGNTDLIINVLGHEYLIESKKYYSPSSFKKGKVQLSYYCKRAGITEGIYLVFVDNTVNIEFVQESVEMIDGIEIKTYLIRYDEEKEFGILP
ncbi:MAG: AAA-like domain-containing protein [Leptospiraceae bacterium]|nr:AAA-like domain-containing protein [Leptospiraceae bacterium]MCP5498253.1 AAA-like domain-containing protein [Leptospiraceae bacterium]